MRRYLFLPVLAACLLLVGSGAAALTTGGPTYYAGKNSQGQKLLFTVDHTASGPMFDPIFINQIDRCPVSGGAFRFEYIFQGFQIPITNGKFNFVLNELTDLLRWSGTITSTGASGTESIDLAGFDSQGGLQDCGAGTLPWSAKALVPATSTTGVPGATYLVKVTKASDGSVHFTITH